MNSRFVRYLGFKGLTQSELSDLSGVPKSTVSRFCAGQPVGSDKLLRMLQVCDDLSLEWLMFNTGDMLRSCEGNIHIVNNNGAYSGSDIAKDNSNIIKNSSGVSVGGFSEGRELLDMILEKDKLIAGKDEVISERDRTISLLQQMLLRR